MTATPPSLVPQRYWDENYENTVLSRHHEDALTKFLRAHIPAGSGNAFEVGCFPGRLLPLLAEKGYTPSGIDLTPRVRELAPWLQSLHLPAGEFLQADFLTWQPTRSYSLVASFGFVEHFQNYKEVFAKHCDLATPGGTLCVTFPNFSGLVQRILHTAFDAENLQLHYLPAMNVNAYADICRLKGFMVIFAGNIGNFDFWRGSAPLSPSREVALKYIKKMLKILNIFPNNHLWSPYSVIIAKKNTTGR